MRYVYTGCFVGNCCHGEGVRVWDDWTRYEGDWASEWMRGEGRDQRSDGFEYVGGFER